MSEDAYDVNVSPDKRTIFLHSEINLISALKVSQSQLSLRTIADRLLDCSRSAIPALPINVHDDSNRSETASRQTEARLYFLRPSASRYTDESSFTTTGRDGGRSDRQSDRDETTTI